MKRSRCARFIRTAAAAAVTATLAVPGGSAWAAGSVSGARGSGLPSGTITTIAGGLGGPGPATAVSLEQIPECFGMQIARGQLYVDGADFVDRLIRVVAVSTGTFYGQAMTAGDIYSIAGRGGEPDGQAMTAGDIYTIAGGGNNGLGDGGPGNEAEVAPVDMAVAPDGDLVIADLGDGRVRLVAH